MSKLNELIQQYCPDGVEYKRLSSIASIIRGSRVVRSQLSNAGCFPVFQNSTTPLGWYDRNNTSEKTTFVIIAGAAGEIGFSYSPFWAADDCLSINCNEELDTRFIYHYLLLKQSFIKSRVRKASVPRLSRDIIEKIEVPLPVLPVQREIVRILDEFSLLSAELTAELAAELAARKEQYEYYRKSLLTFDGDITWGKIGDIGKVSMCKRIMKNETSSNGDIPFFKIGTFGKEPNAYISNETFDKYSKMYSYPKKGDILISAAGTIGRTVVFDGKPAYFQDSNIVWVDNDESKILNSFLYYWYQTNPCKISTGGTIARLYNDNISGAKVPLISIDEQKRIASLLQQFDAITNDIYEGLPAEIEARQKQYEYYRDKLLSFKRLNA